MKKTSLSAILLISALVLVASFSALPAHAQPAYLPGVKVGDSVTFGKINVIWKSNTQPPSSFVRQLNQTKSLQETVTGLNGNVVGATQTFSYNNGTSQQIPGTVNVQNGNGTLGVFILAGGLSAGDQAYQSPSRAILPPIGETITRLYAGALRPVNIINATNTIGGPESQILLNWDSNTGLLVELVENVSYPFESFSIQLKVTSTNAWAPSTTPDFGFDAIQQTNPTFHPGETGTFTLVLNSTYDFNGIINLTPELLNSTQPHPYLTLSQSTVSLLPGQSNPSILRFSTNSSTPQGTYRFAVNGTSGNLSHTIIIATTVTSPDFSMTAQPSNFTLSAGTSKTSIITIRSLGSFFGTISLSATVYGAFTFTLQPTNVTLSSTVTTAYGNLTAHVPSGTPPSQSGSIYLTGRSGTVSHQIYFPVSVTGPDFRISASPILLNIRSGTSAQSTITLTSIQEFNETVNLTALAYGVLASLDKNNVNVNSTMPAIATVSIAAPLNTPPGFYNVVVDGSTANLTRSAYITVNVTAPGFRIGISPSSFILKEGTTGNATVTLTSILGFQGTVILATTIFSYNGPAASITPSSVFLAANSTATATLTLSALTAIPGSYRIQITGISSGLLRTAFVTATVVGPDFTISASPSNLNLLQGSMIASNVTLTRINNFNGTIALSITIGGPSSGIQASITPIKIVINSTLTIATANVTISISKIATPGFYYVEPIGVSGRLSHATFIDINVSPAPEFAINATSPADFNSGGRGTSTIIIFPFNGFTGTVNLTSTTEPNTGLTAECPSSLTVTSPAPVTATCTLSSTTPGVYTVRITATSGSLTHNATFVSNVGSFTLSVNTPVDFNSGATAEVLVSLAGTNDFAGNITLAGSSPVLSIKCPDGPVVLSAGIATQATCSLSGTIAGTYAVAITGTASPGPLSQSSTLTVHVGDFTISSSSGSLNLGTSGPSITISLTSTFNFAGSVSLSSTDDKLTGLNVACPNGAIPLAPNSTSTTSCMLTSTRSDTYQVTITGTVPLPCTSHNTISIVHVGDFTIGLTSSDINYGNEGSISVSLTSLNNFAGPVTLSGTSFPLGLTVACPFAPSITPNSTIMVACSVTSLSPGTYSIMITGVSSSNVFAHSASAVIHIGDFSISIDRSVKFNLGSPSPLISVNLTSSLNFAGTIVLAFDSSPPRGLTVTCPVVTLASNSSTSTYCTLSTNKAGTFLVTIKGTSLPGTGSHSDSGIVQVVDFSVGASSVVPSTIEAGGSGTSLITVEPINGFDGTVTLAVSAPSGLSCSLDHATIQSKGASNLSCTSNTPGDYDVTIIAFGTSTFHETSLTFHFGSSASKSPTMFGLQLPQFYGLMGGIIVSITVAGVAAVVRKNRT